MSEQPNPPPSGGSPNRGPGDASGFNWRLLILLSVAMLILGAAFFGPAMNKSATALSYPEFRTAWSQGRIIKNDPKRPLKVVTTDTSPDATITGWVAPPFKRVEGAEPRREDFQVRFNTGLQERDVREILGGTVVAREVSEAELPREDDVPLLTLAEFSRSHALGEVQAADAGNPLRILTTPNSSEAVIVGTRAVYPLEVPKTAEGKPAEPAPFRVAAPLSILGDDLRELMKNDASFDRTTDYLKGVLSMFLPFLLIILLLFFLFRQQMKSAGRGAMSFGKSKARLLTMDRNKSPASRRPRKSCGKSSISCATRGSFRSSAARSLKAC
jgi:cell division protease FtsH